VSSLHPKFNSVLAAADADTIVCLLLSLLLAAAVLLAAEAAGSR